MEVCGDITTVIHHYTRYKVVLYCLACRLAGDLISARLNAAQDNRWIFAAELGQFAFPAGHRKLLEYMQQRCPERLLNPCG